MTLTATYDPQLSRVRLVAADLDPRTETVRFERSANGITWSTVRGGEAVPVVGGTARLDDYEFAPNTANTYRATAYSPLTVDTFTRTVADGWGSADTGQAWDTAITGTPADFAVDGAHGTITITDAQTAYWAALDLAVADFDATVEVDFNTTASGAAYAAILAARWLNPDNFYFAWVLAGTDNSITVSIGMHDDAPGVLFENVVTSYSNSGLPRFALRFAGEGSTLRAKLWPASDPEPAGWDIELTDTTHTQPGRIALAAERDFGSTNTGLLATFDNLTVTHAAQPIGQDTTQITPELATVWIKNLARPFLNRAVTVTDWGDIERPARGGVFEVVGRTYPVAVTDVRGSRRFELEVMAPTPADADDLELCLSPGDPVLVHVPDTPDCLVPRTLYAVIGTVTISRRSRRGLRRYFTLPLTEVAAPSPAIVGATITYQGILNAFATYADLLAGNATYEDVAERIGDPAEVIVP